MADLRAIDPKYKLPQLKPLPEGWPIRAGLECEAPAQSSETNLFINPPLTCQDISPVPAAIMEYGEAYKAVAEDEILGRKLEKDAPLTRKETAAMRRFDRAKEKLNNIGLNLFKAAFLNEAAPGRALGMWQEYLEKLPTSSREIDVLYALSNPKLDKNDREILFYFVTKYKDQVPPELSERYKEHYRNLSLNYNGWQGANYSDQRHAFMDVLSVYCRDQFTLEKLESHIIAQDPISFITSLEPQEISRLYKLKENEFWSEYFLANRKLYITAPGDKEKIRAFRRVNDIETIALARGLSPVAFQFNDLADSMPGLSPPEYSELISVAYFAKFARGNENSPLSREYKNILAEYIEKYLAADEHSKNKYATALSLLDGLSLQYGFSRQELDLILDEICKKINCSLAGSRAIKSLADLNQSVVTDVSPQGLPKEIRGVLEATGQWELVRDNLLSISFIPRAFTGEGIVSMDYAGLAIPLLKRVEIKYLDEKGMVLPAWQLAAVLIHEAAHVNWRKQDKVLQASTPNERHAYAAEYSFYLEYENRFGRPVDKYFKEYLTQAEAAVRRSNALLGYDRNDLRPENNALPPADFCYKKGLAGPEELDMSWHPGITQPETPKPSILHPIYDINTRNLRWEGA